MTASHLIGKYEAAAKAPDRSNTAPLLQEGW
jgi:hypothetical protein